MADHITRNVAHRIDIESTQLIDDRIIGRVEADLGPADDQDQQSKILTVPYAEKQLASGDDAVEFVRVIRQAVSAGVETDPRSLQVWASWGYDEIRRRTEEFVRDHPDRSAGGASPEETRLARAEITGQVLKEIAFLSMELTAATATGDERLLDEPEVIELFTARDAQETADERRELFELRCDQILGRHETADPFTSEWRAVCGKVSSAHTSRAQHDEFRDHLDEQVAHIDLSSGTADEDERDLTDSFQRTYEQYDENGVVSLHMSDGEKFVVDGTLDDDVDPSYLPREAAGLAGEIEHLFVEGEDTETIDKFIEFRLNDIYGDPADRASRVTRTTRWCVMRMLPSRQRPDGTCSRRHAVETRPAAFEFTYKASAYQNREERQYVREVLEKVLENLLRDFHLRSLNRSGLYRALSRAIKEETDTRALIRTIRQAYQARVNGSISIKMFTALNTAYEVKRAALESTPLRATREVLGRERVFILAAPLMELARTIAARDLRELAARIHTLPAQERERVRRVLQYERPELYARIRSGLLEIVERASQRKRMYLRFAFYEDRNTGRPNEAHNMIHLLTAGDQASVWARLKELSGVSAPAAA